MRSLARRFDGNTIDKKGQRWEMRLLPQPLFRYDAAKDEQSDGAVFAFVTSKLTDPEAILLIETMQTGAGNQWGYSLVRFSHNPAYVQYNGEEIWKVVPVTNEHNKDHTYQLIQQPMIEETWR